MSHFQDLAITMCMHALLQYKNFNSFILRGQKHTMKEKSWENSAGENSSGKIR